MKKILILICFLFILLSGFEQTKNLELTNVRVTIIEENNELRYDFEITNHGNEPIKSEFDYPGNNPYGIELVVQPSEALAQHMETEENSKYPKMHSLGKGSRGYFEANSESYFHVSYLIKEDANLEQVKKHALDSALLILDGTDVSAKFPLKDK